jgi:hypothetical protein
MNPSDWLTDWLALQGRASKAVAEDTLLTGWLAGYAGPGAECGGQP